MTILFIPVAPLNKTKTRLKTCFSEEQLIQLTLAMVKDICYKVKNISTFREIIVYCRNHEVLDIARKNGLIGYQENINNNIKNFDDIIQSLKKIAISEFESDKMLITYIDLVLISKNNLIELNNYLENADMVICPEIRSLGISILGGKPELIPRCFSDPKTPSLLVLLKILKNKNIENIKIYDSFRASFDLDVPEDCILALEYMKLFNLTNSETYKFLKNNVKFTLEKENPINTRKFRLKIKK
ncbi:MAG: hypothetical protein ACP6IY_02155 [Promethearchaeia archaeon]